MNYNEDQKSNKYKNEHKWDFNVFILIFMQIFVYTNQKKSYSIYVSETSFGTTTSLAIHKLLFFFSNNN